MPQLLLLMYPSIPYQSPSVSRLRTREKDCQKDACHHHQPLLLTNDYYQSLTIICNPYQPFWQHPIANLLLIILGSYWRFLVSPGFQLNIPVVRRGHQWHQQQTRTLTGFNRGQEIRKDICSCGCWAGHIPQQQQLLTTSKDYEASSSITKQVIQASLTITNCQLPSLTKNRYIHHHYNRSTMTNNIDG